uniref:FCH and mu domain containing endocytic adaptor 1 n=1 Tax=Oncorhynchus mykiss TaxID=8022 RepID=A0A8C7P1G9_ONCMY
KDYFGFDLLYHNMKHGQIATKELAEFVRERAAIEETYSKSMSKLAKMASNGSPLGTFAPMWDLFRVSSDKLALCHLELMRKMNDLIRDINKYGDEQVKVHRKTKEEQVGTLDAVQAVQVQSGHLQKFREGYHAKCIELDRLRKEGAPQKELEKAEMKSKKSAESFAVCIEKYNRVGGDFEQKMSESAQKFQDIEEAHLRQMKQLIKGYSHSIEDTHVQVGQVHEEFKQNVENIGIDNLIQRFAEQKGTGKDKPALVGFEEYMTALVPEGSKKSRGKAFRIPGLGKRDKEPDSTISVCIQHGYSVFCTQNSPLEVDEEGFVIRADEDNFYSSDSDFDDEEPKKFHIQIRPVGSSSNSAATEKELKATVGALTLPPNRGNDRLPLFPPDAAFSSDSSSPENVEDSGLDSPSHQPLGPSPEPAGWAAWPSTSQNKEPAGLGRPEDPFLTVFRDPSPERSPHPQDNPASIWAAAPRSSRPPPDMDPSALCFPAFSQSLAPPELDPALWSCKHIPPEDPFLAAFERTVTQETLPPPDAWAPPRPPILPTVHLSRGPSPISLSTQELWPVAAAITEYINAYFKGGQHNRCLVKITGDLTMSFPAGITRIFTANPNAPVLSFRLVNISRVNHFLPNQKLLYSDPSQSDPDTRDFWFNMHALNLYLQREAELNPLASYYNVALLKYQVSSQDPGRAPLLLSAECQRSGTVTRVALDYHCCPATAPSTQLTAVQVLLPLDHTATDLQCQPPASWNAEERQLLWKLPNLSPTNHSSGTLCASWQCLEVPRGPPPSLAVQFVGSGASLSGMDVELVGSHYRMSLVKKRFATGKYMAGCSL